MYKRKEKKKQKETIWQWHTQDKAVLGPCVSPAFAITYFCNHCNIRFENTSKYVDTLTLFSKNLNQRSLTPRWPLTPCLLRSHVWLYPRIIVSNSHDNTSMYVDTVINFETYHIHTYMYIHILHTYNILHTTYRMSDHIVSYWTQFRRDNKTRDRTGLVGQYGYSLNVKRVKWLLFNRVKSVRNSLTEWKSLSKRVKIIPKWMKITPKRVKITPIEWISL